MKRTVLLTAVACVVALQSSAYEMQIKDGASWLNVISGSHDPQPMFQPYRQAIDGTETIGDYEALRFCQWDSSTQAYQLKVYLRTDGGRVYFSTVEDPQTWRLCYDFGLKPGESTDVWLVDSNITYIREMKVTCNKVYESIDNPGQEIMEMIGDECAGDGEDVVGIGKNLWVKGVGSLCGIRDIYLSGLIGVGSRMVHFSNGERITYLDPEFISYDDDFRWKECVKMADGSLASMADCALKCDKENTLQLVNRNAEGTETVQANVRVDGYKVYFSSSDRPDDFYLGYDFNMRPGDKNTFYSLSSVIKGQPEATELECLTIKSKYETAYLQSLMVMSKTDGSDQSVSWLRGVGSISGILSNVMPETSQEGEPMLMEAWHGSNKIYDCTWAGIDRVSNDVTAPVKLDGQTLTVGGGTCIYGLDGRVVMTAKGASAVTLPTGLYIVRNGDKVTKVVVR